MTMASGVRSSLFETLVCPVCHQRLEPESATPQEATACLRCLNCGRFYPIQDGIPVMLEARAVSKPV